MKFESFFYCTINVRTDLLCSLRDRKIINCCADELDPNDDFYSYRQEDSFNYSVYNGTQGNRLVNNYPDSEDNNRDTSIDNINSYFTYKIDLGNDNADEIESTLSTQWRLYRIPLRNFIPTDEEIDMCLPMIKKHIELINPKAILLLGSTATYALIRNTEGITKIRGKWVDIEINQKQYPTLPTFHPAFLLRQPGQKKYSWEDLKSLKKKVES